MSIHPNNKTLGRRLWPWTMALLLCTTGCGLFNSKGSSAGRWGRTYYIDGAGNWGFGVSDVEKGLRAAGYRGDIINYRWSPTFNPALDQTVGRPIARAKGKSLGREITDYLERYPGNPVNIIALSAGTGVAVWACENVTSSSGVQSLVLLGSSLSSEYDMSPALANIEQGVWVYYSRYDQILQGPVRTLGTIDGKLGVNPAGLVGLRYKSDKVHNIPWSPRYERYGWSGAHTDATSEPMVRIILARHIFQRRAPAGEWPGDEAHAGTAGVHPIGQVYLSALLD
jgi:hypothetical protein